MLKIVFLFLTYMFAGYGLITLAIQLIDMIHKKTNLQDKKIRAVLLVKNCEDIIEGIMRSSIYSWFTRRLISDGSLTVVDMGSQDETLDILERMSSNDEGFRILREGEKEKVFDVFDEISEEK